MLAPVTESQIKAARACGLHFFWQIRLVGGRVVSQFTGEGREVPILDTGLTLLTKPQEDPYAATPVFLGAEAAALVPTRGTQGVVTNLRSGEHLILFRRNFLPVNPSLTTDKYVVYCIGVREEKVPPVEEVTYMEPSCVYSFLDKKLGQHNSKNFAGGIERSTDPKFITSLERWLRD